MKWQDIEEFLAARCDGCALDNDEDRRFVARRLAKWFEENDAGLRQAVLAFVETIEATGGVYDNEQFDPVGDAEWGDLGDAYVKVCRALGRPPVIAHDDE